MHGAAATVAVDAESPLRLQTPDSCLLTSDLIHGGGRNRVTWRYTPDSRLLTSALIHGGGNSHMNLVLREV